MLDAAVVITLWVMTIWRWPGTRDGRSDRALWLAFAVIAIAMTLRLDPIEHAVDHASRVPALATLLKHLCGLLSTAAVLDFVNGLTTSASDRPRLYRGHIAAVAGAVTMVALFAVMPRHASAGFIDEAAGDPLPTAYLAVFFTYLCAVMAKAEPRFRRARADTTGWLRLGLTTLAAGAATGAGYAAYRLAFLAVRLVTALPGGDLPYIAVSDAMKAVALLLIAAGCALPAADHAIHRWQHHRALNELRPLWHTLTTAVPDVVLGTAPNRANDLLNPRRIRMRLVRRTVEIRDAALLLRGWASGTRCERARTALADADLADIPLDAAAEAVLLTVAIRAHRAGTPSQTTNAANADLLSGGTDLDEEVTWLRHVARGMRHPAVTTAAHHLANQPPASQPDGHPASAPAAA